MIPIALSILVFAGAALVPGSAHAYLLPLIGAGGAIITMLIGIMAAVFSAVYLVFYNIRRAIRRRMGKESPADEDKDPQ